MRKFIIISVLLAVAGASVFFSCGQKKRPPEQEIEHTLLLQVDTFSAMKNKLLQAVEGGKPDEKQLQQLFLQTRIAYKKFEWAAEYFAPVVSRFVNGPPVQEIEMGSGQVFEAAGLQVIEGYLFPVYDHSQKPELVRQLKLLGTGCDKYKAYFSHISILNWQVFDATKQEVFRILSLGITGFDNPLTLKSSQESVAALQSLNATLAYYEAKAGTENLPQEFSEAITYLNNHSDFNSFNRAGFITTYGNQISTGISNLAARSNLPVIKYNRLLNQNAKTLFDKDAFNANAYASDQSAYLTAEKVALGNALFSDPVLSGSGTRSCRSCHQPEKAFTDGLAKNTVINSRKQLRRNTPTLINAALQPAQFYDLRASTLEDQALNVVQNKDEMHGSMRELSKRLWKKPAYRQMFSAAFPKKDRTAIDTLEIMNAIGSYVRSLVSLNSRFDDYMRGNKVAMNPQEVNGFNLFMGKAKCATCHYMPLFNGSFPPRYMIVESEVIGVPQSITQKAIDTDMGRYDQLKAGAFKHAFKITTVRNAARTAPYMHNGVFTTLQQVMDFYNKGGGAGLGFKLDNQTLPSGKLDLTQKESDDIIAFIKALDSR